MCLFGVASAQPQIPQPEVQIFFPDQAALIDGQSINPRQALVVRTVDNIVLTDTFDLSTITGLNLTDQTAITGFSAKSNGGPSNTYSYIFSLSTASGNFVRGDIIECNFDGCSLLDSFGQNTSISALDYINRIDDLYVSFDTSFEVDNNWIEPTDVYRSGDFAVVYDGSNAGLDENNAITAFDTSEFLETWSPLGMAETTKGLISAAEVYSASINTSNSIVEELTRQVTGINAYYSVNSGWLEFDVGTINVAENAGIISFNVNRVDGVEGVTGAVVLDIDGTAVDGVDYNGLLNQYLWVDGDDQSIEVTLSIIDNDVEDGNRSFTIDLREPNNDFSFSLINPNKNLITVNIIDDDGDLIFADGFE